MARTCIICGNAAGSAEHIFPAALGGRRKNRSIYCDPHNAGYSDLVALLASQLEPINSLLEVRSDRTNQIRPASATEIHSGESMKVTGGRAELPAARILRQDQHTDDSVVQHHSMLSKKDAWAQIDEMRDRGILLGYETPKWTPRVVGTLRLKMELGSDKGLRAAGYILQTYFAQEFPELARSAALDSFKAYTLGVDPTPRVWWDFKMPLDYIENAFKFGHRVLVGVEPASGTIYGRLTLFSTVSFAAELGRASPQYVPSKAVVIDIDPLAKPPPRDQARQEVEPGAHMPVAPSAGELEEAIKSGAVAAAFGKLLTAIEDDMRDRQAQGIIDRLQTKASGSPEEKEAVLADIGEELLQRVFNLTSHFVGGLSQQPQLAGFAPDLVKLLRLDAAATHGIEDKGFEALRDCTSAIVDQLREDWTSSRLSLDDVAMLIGGGRGVAVVGRVLITKYARVML